MMFTISKRNKINTSTLALPGGSPFFKPFLQPKLSNNQPTDIYNSFFRPAAKTIPAQANTIIQKQSQAVSSLPQRGPNPSSCFTTICNTLTKPTSSCINDPRQCAKDFKKDVMSCLTANAAASNAANSSEILANTSGEIDNQIDYMNAQMPDLKKQEDKRQYIDWLLSFCKMKKREVWIEFNYNVIFENAQGQRPWVFYENEWDEIEAAIRAIPDEHLWGRSPTLPVVHFRRESFGPPSPTGSGQVGGDTDTSTGLIRIFDAGIGTTPFSRSKNIGVTATDQTLRHEVGHIVDATIPTAAMNDFFHNIVQWNQYSWAWITTHPSIYPTWQAERRKVCDELNFINKNGQCDETRLDSFFASVSSGNLTMNGRQYSKSPFFLVSWPAGNVPSSVEFEYARTSQGEYFAELYALAISAPSFLARSIPFAQVDWLKAHVFNTDALYKSIIAPYKNLAINASATMQTQYQELLNSADDMFTEQQLQSVSAKLQLLFNQMSVPQTNATLV